MSAIAIIPARYSSTRFPGKPLCMIAGKPMIQHVYENVKRAKGLQNVFVATDSSLIYDAVTAFGGIAVKTYEKHESGTDRIAEAVNNIGTQLNDDDVIVNVQGDEPMIKPEMVDNVVEIMNDSRAAIGTLAKRITSRKEIEDPNVVKVIFDQDGFAYYFSRAPIPYHRELFGKENFNCDSLYMFKHIGIYAYRKKVLVEFSKMAASKLESIEMLEQLRALERGYKIKIKETLYETIGVDTPMDIERVEKCLNMSL
ncbi:MAG: 3-deoxy-manno-octulosonate cytidylyltransferase [Nitrospirae bacterium]|nr:3-deoxy-manno-octulosonate cytidylyltransferase [Nitrospirota bacterium]